jgi:signal transduction histidine kinase
MNLKIRSAILFGLIVTVLLSIVFGIIYIENAWFRKDEFELRLEQRAEAMYKLLTDENQIDSALLQVIDQNTLNKLYDESVLIFNQDNRVIYSSTGERKITLPDAFLGKIRRRGYLAFSENEMEAVGKLMEGGEGAIVVASGYDKYGKRKLSNLFSVLSICWLGGIFITGLLSYIYVRRVFKPLDVLNANIQEVTEGNLKQRITIGPAEDELTVMAKNFNKMLDQLEQSFMVQKNFLQHASHELRTPLSNMLLQTESALNTEMTKEEYKEALLTMYDDQKFLIDMVNGILSLSKYEQPNVAGAMQSFRIDELLFEVTEEIKTYHPEFNIQIDFSLIPTSEKEIMISGVPSMMKIAFTNLIRNGCVYSTDKSVRVNISSGDSQIIINFYNDGPVILPDERNKLFIPFFRGSNVSQKRGHGLGLSITKRIIDVHKGQLLYATTKNGLNCFTVMLFNF